eukprot:CCRYP_014793-RC/>CCRYP_014793-RC protein AED:0.06 eAED:0.18 QI:0/0/0/1/0.5/0.66/3/0/269
MTLAEGHVWTAFGLTFAAGTATLIGASVVFFPKLVKLASRRVLAGSLGFSASMMIYISFVDIFRKSFDAFKSSGMEESRAYGLATLCVFIGVLMTKPDIAFRAPAHSQLSATEEKKKLVRMGLTTATALAIHNFPEGLATFVAALEDPFSGAVLAIAIGAHNIPEGLCVALPIYYGTGSRWRGFFWGVVSGMAEPVAAILGWLVLATTLSLEVYAVLFGLVSGIMVMISLKELLPTAHRYDPEDAVVTYCAIVGMGVMALSLVLFKFST